ncbi:MAG: hypothetical protein ACTS6J_02145 [Burkholderiales bacterium]
MGWLLKLVTGRPLILLWIVGGAFAAGLASGGSGAWWLQGLRLDSAKAATKVLQAKFDGFKETAKAQGEAAQKAADLQKAKDKADKEKADAENKRARALDRQRIASLRYDRDHSGAYSLPAAPAGSSHPDLACFDRADLERADREVLGRLRAIADQGDSATIDLDTAKAWAR